MVVATGAFDSARLEAVATDGGAGRVVPLLITVAGPEAGAAVVVAGEALVSVDAEREVHCAVRIDGTWKIAERRVTEAKEIDETQLATALSTKVFAVLRSDTDDASLDEMVAGYAKAMCEVARDAGTALRAARYDVEEDLARESSNEIGGVDHTTIVASLLRLSVLSGRVADTCAEAVREGLRLYVEHNDLYHWYREQRDSALVTRGTTRQTEIPGWMRLHDAAIRHCEALRDSALRESASIGGLLSAAASISSSRDAEAQSRMNKLVAILSIGIGVPALVLSLYGAEVLLPLSRWRQWAAFSPVFVALLLASIIAMTSAPEAGPSRRTWRIAATSVIVILGFLVFGAAIVVSRPISGG